MLLFLWNSRQFRVISKALKCGCFFCFARLMSEFLTVGRSWSGSFIPPYRSVVTRCAAISLESPLFHRDRARCSRAENGALWKTSYAPPRYTANAFQRERKCTRTLCTRWCFAHGSFAVDSLAFAIALFFFLVFSRKETNFPCLRVFADVCRLAIVISGAFRVLKEKNFPWLYTFGNVWDCLEMFFVSKS